MRTADPTPTFARWFPGTVAALDPLDDLSSPVVLVRDRDGRLAAADGGTVAFGPIEGGWPVAAVLPPLPPGTLGDPAFRADHGVR